MIIGALDRKIVLLAPTDTQDGAGQTTESYAPVAPFAWASINQASAREQIRDGVNDALAAYAIRIRFRDDVSEKWRIQWGDKLLEVASVITIGRRIALDLIATEIRT